VDFKDLVLRYRPSVSLVPLNIELAGDDVGRIDPCPMIEFLDYGAISSDHDAVLAGVHFALLGAEPRWLCAPYRRLRYRSRHRSTRSTGR
jgi:hypothetical protein